MKTTFTLLILLFPFLVLAQQRDWQWINPTPQGNTLQALANPGGTDVLVAVGANGTIMRSSDFGENWLAVSSPTKDHLWATHFLNGTTGFAVGTKGTILKTETGGNSWTVINEIDARLYTVHFISDKIGFVGGGGHNASTQAGENYLYRTDDGGATWTKVLQRQGDPLWRFNFTDQAFGYAITSFARDLILTYDGGRNWVVKPLPLGFQASDVVFTDKDNGALLDGSGPNKAWITRDGGNTWIDGGIAQYGRIGAIGKDVLYHAGQSGLFLSTTGGIIWRKKLEGTKQQMTDVFMKDTLRAVGIGYKGDLYKADFDSASWVSVHQNIDQTYQDRFHFDAGIKSVHFPSASTGYAGVHYNDNSIALMKTVNGGCDWENIGTFYNTTFYTYFLSENVGFVSSGNESYTQRAIQKTTDGGKTWQECLLPNFTSIITSIHFVDDKVGYAVSASGQVLLSTDGGLNWSLTTGNGAALCCRLRTDLHFISTSTGFAVNGTNKIVRTEDFGQTWQMVYSNQDMAIRGVTFINQQVGFAVAGDNSYREDAKGFILKTTDGGQSWLVDKQVTGDLVDVHFLDSQNGYIVGRRGNILNTADGGNSWVQEESHTGNNLNNFFSTEDGTLYVWGSENSTLLKKPVHPKAAFTPGSTVVCQNEAITFENQSLSSYNFNWKANGVTFSTAKSPSHTFAEAGKYTITLVADNCGYQDEVQHTITVLPMPEKPILAAEGVTITDRTYIACDKSALDLRTTGTYAAYEWVYRGGTSTAGTLQLSQDDTVYVKVRGENGCYNLSDTLIVQFKITPTPTFEVEQNGLELTFKNTSASGDAFRWDFGDGNYSDDASPVHTYAAHGTYTVKLTAGNYCGEGATHQEVEVRPADLERDVSVFPNPVEGTMTIAHVNGITPPVSVVLLDAMGRSHAIDVQVSKGKTTMDLSKLKPGLYYVQMFWPEASLVKKIIKK